MIDIHRAFKLQRGKRKEYARSPIRDLWGTSMNMNRVRALAIACAVAVVTACGGGGSGGDGISPGDANAVMRAISVKVGDAEGVLLPDTNFPPASGTSEQPVVAVQRALTQTTNGATAQVPLSTSSNSPIANLFFKVAGSSDLIRVGLSSPSPAAARALTEQRAAFFTQNLSKELSETMSNLELSLPPNILAGAFDVEVVIEDEDGLVSLSATGTIQITRVGTGTLQFSLSWDAAVDLDLEVTDPAGDLISFVEPTSPSGGRLDRDNRDGGPGSIENIFWETSAPNGTYKVDVNYFSLSGPAANFVVTVSINGTVIDTISRANFTANDGRLPVYDLNFGGNAGNSSGVIFPDRSPASTDNDPEVVLARLQGEWGACFQEGNSSERETLSVEGNRVTASYQFYPSSGNCTGTPSESGTDVVDIVIGEAVVTTSGVIANELDITFVSTTDPDFSPGDQFFDIIFVGATQLIFGDADIGGETPAERPDTLDLSYVLNRQ